MSNMQPQIPPIDQERNDDSSNYAYTPPNAPNRDNRDNRDTVADLGDRLRDLLHESIVRRIVVKNPAGQVIVEVPLLFGIIITLAVPWLVAILAVLAIVSNYPMSLERRED